MSLTDSDPEINYFKYSDSDQDFDFNLNLELGFNDIIGEFANVELESYDNYVQENYVDDLSDVELESYDNYVQENYVDDPSDEEIYINNLSNETETPINTKLEEEEKQEDQLIYYYHTNTENLDLGDFDYLKEDFKQLQEGIPAISSDDKYIFIKENCRVKYIQLDDYILSTLSFSSGDLYKSMNLLKNLYFKEIPNLIIPDQTVEYDFLNDYSIPLEAVLTPLEPDEMTNNEVSSDVLPLFSEDHYKFIRTLFRSGYVSAQDEKSNPFGYIDFDEELVDLQDTTYCEFKRLVNINAILAYLKAQKAVILSHSEIIGLEQTLKGVLPEYLDYMEKNLDKSSLLDVFKDDEKLFNLFKGINIKVLGDGRFELTIRARQDNPKVNICPDLFTNDLDKNVELVDSQNKCDETFESFLNYLYESRDVNSEIEFEKSESQNNFIGLDSFYLEYRENDPDLINSKKEFDVDNTFLESLKNDSDFINAQNDLEVKKNFDVDTETFLKLLLEEEQTNNTDISSIDRDLKIQNPDQLKLKVQTSTENSNKTDFNDQNHNLKTIKNNFQKIENENNQSESMILKLLTNAVSELDKDNLENMDSNSVENDLELIQDTGEVQIEPENISSQDNLNNGTEISSKLTQTDSELIKAYNDFIFNEAIIEGNETESLEMRSLNSIFSKIELINSILEKIEFNNYNIYFGIKSLFNFNSSEIHYPQKNDILSNELYINSLISMIFWKHKFSTKFIFLLTDTNISLFKEMFIEKKVNIKELLFVTNQLFNKKSITFNYNIFKYQNSIKELNTRSYFDNFINDLIVNFNISLLNLEALELYNYSLNLMNITKLITENRILFAKPNNISYNYQCIRFEELLNSVETDEDFLIEFNHKLIKNIKSDFFEDLYFKKLINIVENTSVKQIDNLLINYTINTFSNFKINILNIFYTNLLEKYNFLNKNSNGFENYVRLNNKLESFIQYLNLYRKRYKEFELELLSSLFYNKLLNKNDSILNKYFLYFNNIKLNLFKYFTTNSNKIAQIELNRDPCSSDFKNSFKTKVLYKIYKINQLNTKISFSQPFDNSDIYYSNIYKLFIHKKYASTLFKKLLLEEVNFNKNQKCHDNKLTIIKSKKLKFQNKTDAFDILEFKKMWELARSSAILSEIKGCFKLINYQLGPDKHSDKSDKISKILFRRKNREQQIFLNLLKILQSSNNYNYLLKSVKFNKLLNKYNLNIESNSTFGVNFTENVKYFKSFFDTETDNSKNFSNISSFKKPEDYIQKVNRLNTTILTYKDIDNLDSVKKLTKVNKNNPYQVHKKIKPKSKSVQVTNFLLKDNYLKTLLYFTFKFEKNLDVEFNKNNGNFYKFYERNEKTFFDLLNCEKHTTNITAIHIFHKFFPNI